MICAQLNFTTDMRKQKLPYELQNFFKTNCINAPQEARNPHSTQFSKETANYFAYILPEQLTF